ncbi:MAG: galactokinase family protein [Patescibacteria group bacterium]|nr:galactokinase family protein [Patescibacteria group bacterium]
MPNPRFLEQLRQEVVRRYGVASGDVRIVRSPYRICPLGAHIDHQLGHVTAMAIDRAVHVAYVPLVGEVRLASLDFAGEAAFSLAEVPDRRNGDWGNFARGAVRALKQHCPLRHGIQGVTTGRLDGGGLSSSAAIGVALLLALEEANGLTLTEQDNISLDQAIENEYLGLRNGILDQSAILLSRRDQLTYLDCQTRCHELIPAAADVPSPAILIAFSGLKKALVGTDYNRRVEECREAAEQLLHALGRADAMPVLRNITPDEYAQCQHVLKGEPARRAAHFYSEMERVRLGLDCWRRGDLAEFGRLITASGESSIRNYECGCPPLVDLHEILVGTEGVYGARFSGAGFRGCCFALTDAAAVEAAAESVVRRYRQRQPRLAGEAFVLRCHTDDGARHVQG